MLLRSRELPRLPEKVNIEQDMMTGSIGNMLEQIGTEGEDDLISYDQAMALEAHLIRLIAPSIEGSPDSH